VNFSANVRSCPACPLQKQKTDNHTAIKVITGINISARLYARNVFLNVGYVLAVELFPDLFLDKIPAFFRMGQNAPGTVLHAGWQGGIVARAVKEEEGAIAEEARMPVFELVARQELAFEIDKVSIVHLSSSKTLPSFLLLKLY
jgi:hypothetical protein